MFAVVHGSMPRFNVPDIILDVQRSVRFIRHNAAEFGVDPNRLGVLGSSSGWTSRPDDRHARWSRPGLDRSRRS